MPPDDSAENACGDNLTWRIENDTLYIEGEGDMWDFVEWDKDAEQFVNAKSPWISKINNTKIHIDNGVTSIGDYAFDRCKTLAKIEIPDSVTSIGDKAFFGCRFLEEVDIPDSVAYIGDEAFYACVSLAEFEIPDSVTSISGSAFVGCDNLRDIYYGGLESDWKKIAENLVFNNPNSTTIHYNSK